MQRLQESVAKDTCFASSSFLLRRLQGIFESCECMVHASSSLFGMLCFEAETELSREVCWFASIERSGEYLLWEFVIVVKKRNVFGSYC